MPDAQSAEERAIIDAAIAAGKVTKVPTGVSGEHQGFVYDQAEGKLVLRRPDLDSNEARRKRAHEKRLAGRTAEAEARRRRVPLHMANGLDADAIAAREGVAVSTVLEDARALKMTFDRPAPEPEVRAIAAPASRVALPAPGQASAPGRPKPPISKPKPEVTARRARVAALAKAGRSGAEIAAELGVTPGTIYSDVRTMPGVALSRAVGAAARNRNDPAMQERRAAVQAAYDGTRTVPEIARMTGVPQRSVRDHLAALELEPIDGKSGRPISPRDQRVIDERRAQLPAMIEAGKNGREIAEHFGVTRAVIDHDCRKIGTRIPRGRRSKPQGKGAIAQARHMFATAHGRFVSTMLQAGVPRAEIATIAAGIVAPPSAETIRIATARRLIAEDHSIEAVADVLGLDPADVSRLVTSSPEDQ
ncbi:hypothetical protein [Limimaricola cinnabarinus]|uniref:hypothetical protein n=1 Tax=Limimaricola cinnabarinus TaxID=1125964 RepID=UPI002FE210DD